MSRIGGKRVNATAKVEVRRKRRKVCDVSNGRKKSPTSSEGLIPTLTANELAWKKVTPPEQLDDAEGFFGLEEIDDVEVIRDVEGRKPDEDSGILRLSLYLDQSLLTYVVDQALAHPNTFAPNVKSVTSD